MKKTLYATKNGVTTAEGHAYYDGRFHLIEVVQSDPEAGYSQKVFLAKEAVEEILAMIISPNQR